MKPKGLTHAPLDRSLPSTQTLQTCHVGQLSKVLHQGKWLLDFPTCSNSILLTLKFHAECRHQGYRGPCTAAWGRCPTWLNMHPALKERGQVCLSQHTPECS